MSDTWNQEDVLADELHAALVSLYTTQMRAGYHANRVESLVMALLKALIDSGEVSREQFEEARARLAEAKTESDERPLDVIIGEVGDDKYTVESPPDLDCAALIPICKAKCCQFSFPLTAQDLEEGRVSWDYARPYLIKRRPSGLCVHQEEQTRRCTIYDQRPGVCRRFDCRNDKRIWLDFDKRIPAAPPDET